MVQLFDPLFATATDLQQLLDEGRITTRKIVERYLNQIETHNLQGMKLHAIIDVAPLQQIF